MQREACAHLWDVAHELSELSGRPTAAHFSVLLTHRNARVALDQGGGSQQPCGCCTHCQELGSV